MKKGKEFIQNVVEKIAISIATVDANTACPCISYQPKMPKAVQGLKKM